ncbi:Transcriptional regulator, TetR family [Candidatus Phaeomarinobacter ectocarpi]|uniref:Transcriptional regulator, TetR family n=1 Tax=Candidatus Phaeomarinibacter ectocarpi TaxID=1458461 RepID=X5MPA0_9HYPH|nr:TetR/AcrR family transcriptional regulator [Candidatus Phaeomarinobacter ectocarpi]CDO61171.1 Transcriptional regulator, TetR family [Candidatus Phaeomarinobacter ectocarpi]
MSSSSPDTSAKPARRENTKIKLIRAAERLFAENGLGAVSVRDITRAAGARNESALHYHFGSKEALIRAVFADRISDIDSKRLALIAELDRSQAGQNVQLLMEATIAPMLEACLDEGGRLYATFLMQIAADPRFDVDRLMDDLAPDGVQEVTQRLQGMLQDLPLETRATRLRRLATMSISIMADHAREVANGTAPALDWAIAEAGTSIASYLTCEPGSA